MYFSELEKRGFEGVDASLATSLYEYGLVWKTYKVGNPSKGIALGDTLFYYAVNWDDSGNATEFDWSHLFNWVKVEAEYRIDWDAFPSYEGMTRKEWLALPVTCQISDLVNYYGYENIFGTCYSSIEITTNQY